MRGKHSPPSRQRISVGITPADAGKTNTVPVYGRQPIGSPPRMRGKLNRNEPAAGLTGITPADAGKTRVW